MVVSPYFYAISLKYQEPLTQHYRFWLINVVGSEKRTNKPFQAKRSW